MSRLDHTTFVHLARIRSIRGAWLSDVDADIIINNSDTYSHKDYPVRAKIGVVGMRSFPGVEFMAKTDKQTYDALDAILPDDAHITPFGMGLYTTMQVEPSQAKEFFDRALPIVYERDDPAMYHLGSVLVNFTNMLAFYLPD